MTHTYLMYNLYGYNCTPKGRGMSRAANFSVKQRCNDTKIINRHLNQKETCSITIIPPSFARGIVLYCQEGSYHIDVSSTTNVSHASMSNYFLLSTASSSSSSFLRLASRIKNIKNENIIDMIYGQIC